MPIGEVLVVAKLIFCACIRLLAVSGVAMLVACRGSADQQPRPAVAETAPTVAGATPRDDVAAFLREVGPAFQTASSACFAAEQCGSIERDPKRGALASAAEMPACLKARVPICGAMSEKLIGQVPPHAIAQLWPGILKFRVMRSFQHALLTLQLITDAKGRAPDMRLTRKGYADVEDWVAVQHLPLAAKYAALRDESAPWQEATIALDDWTRVNELCGPDVGCGFEKVMNGAR